MKEMIKPLQAYQDNISLAENGKSLNKRLK